MPGRVQRKSQCQSDVDQPKSWEVQIFRLGGFTLLGRVGLVETQNPTSRRELEEGTDLEQLASRRNTCEFCGKVLICTIVHTQLFGITID